jgi:hypothetical protein
LRRSDVPADSAQTCRQSRRPRWCLRRGTFRSCPRQTPSRRWPTRRLARNDPKDSRVSVRIQVDSRRRPNATRPHHPRRAVRQTYRPAAHAARAYRPNVLFASGSRPAGQRRAAFTMAPHGLVLANATRRLLRLIREAIGPCRRPVRWLQRSRIVARPRPDGRPAARPCARRPHRR